MTQYDTNSTPDHFSPITKQEVDEFKDQLDSTEAVASQADLETKVRRVRDSFAHHAIVSSETAGDASPEAAEHLGDILAGIEQPDQPK